MSRIINKKIVKNTLVFVLVFMIGFSNIPFEAVTNLISLYVHYKNTVDKIWLLQGNSNIVDNFDLWQLANRLRVDEAEAANTVVYVSSTAITTWTVPSNWNNASNTIEIIGGGGGGNKGSGNNTSGGGGGAGAYGKISNISLSVGANINIQVGAGGAAATSGIITFFNWNGTGSTSSCSATTMSVCAGAGGAGISSGGGAGGGSGGVATSTVSGKVLYNGGQGGNGNATGYAGGGGGGAAGKNGAGNFTSSNTTTTGGKADNGSGGAGGTAGAPGNPGGNGTEWSSSPAYGSGGGGGGGNSSSGGGGGGGTYGGGGGGGAKTNAGGAGSQGLIVITYTPIVPTPILTVSTNGTQTSYLNSGASANYIGANFTFVLNSGTGTSTSIKITKTGTVADGGIANFKLYYNTTSTYNATGQSQFGSSASFTNGSSTIAGNMSLYSASTTYIFPVFDIASTTPGGQNINLTINNQSTDIVLQNATDTQTSAVALSGITTTTPVLSSFINSTESFLTDGGRNSQVITLYGAGFGSATSSLSFTIAGNTFTVSSTANTVATATIPSNWPDTNNGGTNQLQASVSSTNALSSSTFYIYPQITSITVPAGFPANTARTYRSTDSDGLITVNGHNFGSPNGSNPLTILGINNSGYVTWGSNSITSVQVPISIANNAYTGNIVLTRTDAKNASTTVNGFRILPRIGTSTPVSGVASNIIQLLGDHFCQDSGFVCPTGGASSATDNVKFSGATSTNFNNLTGGAGACNGAGNAWVDGEVCVQVPNAAPAGASSTIMTSNSYTSNAIAFTVNSSAPNTPTSLAQYINNNAINIAAGGYSSSTTMFFDASLSSGSAINMALQIEVEPSSTAFTGNPNVTQGPTCTSCTATSTNTSSSTLSSNNLPNGQGYHWQARAINTTTNATSSWVLFGSSGSTDFIVQTIAPTLTNATATSILTTSAIIQWNTNVTTSTNKVEYSSTTSNINGNCATTCTAGSASTVNPQSITLSGLVASTTYWFVAISQNLAGLIGTSSPPVQSFNTSSTSNNYQATGYAISPTFDTGAATGTNSYGGASFNAIIASGTTPNNTSFGVQFAASDNPNGAWTYYGPDCTTATYYFNGAFGGSPTSTAILCPSLYNNQRYFRYKVLMCSNGNSYSGCGGTGGATTPEIDKITINWSP